MKVRINANRKQMNAIRCTVSLAHRERMTKMDVRGVNVRILVGIIRARRVRRAQWIRKPMNWKAPISLLCAGKVSVVINIESNIFKRVNGVEM